MKTIFKILAILLFIVLILGGLVFATLGNETIMNKVTAFALKQSGMDINYGSMKGNLFDGLELKDFNYEDKVKADLKLKANFGKLKEGVVHVEELEVTNLFIDKKFLESLGGGNDNKEDDNKSDSKPPIKMVIVDHAKLNLVNFDYQQYHIDKLDLDLKDLKYDMDKDIQGDIKADLVSAMADAKMDIHIKDKKYKLDLDAKPKADFLNTFTKEHNLTVKNAPTLKIKADGDYEVADAKIDLAGGEFVYQDIIIKPEFINLKTNHGLECGKNSSSIDAVIDSNAAKLEIKGKTKLNINDINNTLKFDLYSFIKPKKEYISSKVKDKKLTIDTLPTITLNAKGDFNAIKTDILIDKSALIYDSIDISPKKSTLFASYSVNSGKLDANISSVVNSDIIDFDLLGDVTLNTNDINNTLKIDLSSHLDPKNDKRLRTLLSEQNVTIKQMPKIVLDLKGDYKKLNLLTKVGKGDIKYNNYRIKPQLIDIDADYSLSKGDLDADINASIKSNIANLDLISDIKLNTNDINNTLIFDTDAKIIATPRELKEFNIKITKPTHITLKSKGDMKNITSLLDLNGELVYDKIKIKPKIYDTKVDFSLKTKELDAILFADIKSSVGKLNSKTKLSLDLNDLNNTLKYNTNLLIKDTKPYKGVDLSSLGDIKIDVKGSLKDLDAYIKSPKIKLIAKSSDFNKFSINLDTKKVDIGKIYRYLPKELQKSFVNIKSVGFYRLSKNEAKFHTKLRGFKYAQKVISTDEFDFHMKGEDISLSNFTLKADGFDLKCDVKKVGDKIKATIDNKAIKADANLKLDPLYIDANVKIDSIKKLVKEINKVYPLKLPMAMDGRLDLVANMEGEDAKIALTSPKIEFEEGRLTDLNILSLYNKDRVLIKNFDFFLKGFDPKEFNRKVNLKKDGLIVLTKDKVSIDLELENLLKFKAKQDGDVVSGTLDTNKLLLAYKEYGSTKLTTKLQMYQSKQKLAVTGFIELKDTDITYESSYLDVSKDQDIIIIKREDKGKKKEDTFKKNTFLDIDIRSKNEIIYKVPAGEVEMKPDMNIRKELGQGAKITGKLKILDGFYDVAGKRFLLKEGAVAFRGVEKVNPHLDLHVEYDEVDDILIKIDIGGDKNRPKLNFTSEPVMSKKDILSALLFGFVVSESDGAASSANKAAENIFGRAVAQDLARELKLDRLDLGRNDLGGIDIKAGKKINRKSIIYYKNKSNESSVIYEKKLDKKWSIETEIGKQGYGVDLFFRKGYK